MVMTPETRVWRLRKQNQQVDVRLRDAEGQDGVETRFFYNGTLAYVRRWPTREQALADASERREELERGGWTAHW